VELLEKHLGKEVAEDYADLVKSEEYADIEGRLNLKCWMMAKYCPLPMGKPFEREHSFTMARYAFSMSEVQRLIEEHGRYWITQLCNELSEMDKRTSKELFETIEKVTGEDMAARLGQYQSFEDRKEGQRKYIAQFNEAAKISDYEDMLFSLLRVIELEEFQYSGDNLKRWYNTARLLFQTGYEDAADEVMHNCIELFSNSPVPHGREAVLEAYLMYSLNINRPERALNHAEELLKSGPENIIALTVQMLGRVKSGQLTEARKLAQRITELAESEESASYKTAQRVLAIDANEPDEQED